LAPIRVDKGPDSVDNRDPLWTVRPAGARRDGRPTWTTPTTSGDPLRPTRGCPPHHPPRRPDRAQAVHRATSIVHHGRQHGHEAPSTASTPWWWWWRS